mmetsp:Transcript_24219/g.39030  ORF Transcript_24219/g.39030 Transcript_24219/m.39030 type:complete len:143 (+) Transcript_24219:880-1308(+)
MLDLQASRVLTVSAAVRVMLAARAIVEGLATAVTSGSSCHNRCKTNCSANGCRYFQTQQLLNVCPQATKSASCIVRQWILSTRAFAPCLAAARGADTHSVRVSAACVYGRIWYTANINRVHIRQRVGVEKGFDVWVNDCIYG